MAKKNKKEKKENIVELCAALGFLIGSVTWFCIYFPKSGLYYEKMVIYMIVGLVIGGMVGEGIQYFKKNKNK